MKKKLLAVLIVSTIAGCATTKTMQAVGGSRSDGVVRLAFEYGMFEKPQVDAEQALTTARNRCQVWGYEDAEAFGGVMEQCVAAGQYGCNRSLVTVEYQCTGAGQPQ